MIRQEICELIQRRLAGGIPADGFEPFLQEINLYLDHAVAQAAVRSYRDNAAIEVEFIGDAFNATYKDIALTKESGSGYWKGTLPAPPMGLPRGYDISSVVIAGVSRYSKPLIRVSPQQVDFYRDLPKPKAVFYWVEGKTIYADTFFSLLGKKLVVTMAGSAGSRALTDELLCPAEYIPMVIEYTMTKFIQSLPKDVSTDGINIK